MPRVTALYAGLLLLLYLLLTWRVLARRYAAQIVLGTGGDRALERAARVHANFAEYAPVFIVTLALAELCGAPGWALQAAGAAMLAGRALHAGGMSQEPDILPLRASGMILTLLAMAAAAALALAGAAGSWA